MKNRVKYLFKINDEVVVEENRDLTFNEVDRMKRIIAEECEANIFDIEVERVEMSIELSEFDVTSDGLVNFKDTQFKVITGVTCNVIIDYLLDKILENIADEVLDLS